MADSIRHLPDVAQRPEDEDDDVERSRPSVAVIGSEDPGNPVESRLRDLHRRIAMLDGGALAAYIPELARADPSWFGIALVTADGHVYEVGDTDRAFTIQSVSKPLVFGMALDDQGLEHVLDKVGVEPTGDSFNSIVLDEASGRPSNPMVNAGAIVTSTLVRGVDRAAQLARILKGLARFVGREVGLDEEVFASERAAGHRNRAIAHLMRAAEMLDDDVDGALDLYFRQCSARVTCRDVAVIAATLANRGVNPVTGERALEERHVASVLSVMSTCGMYDYAGEWIYRVGMPAKSGVSGGLMAVLPGQFGIGIFSPPLDRRGNSVRGIAVCEELSKGFGLHLFTPHSSVRSTVRRAYRGDTVRSKRERAPIEIRALDDDGARVRIYELQGDAFFGSMESLTRAVAADLSGARFVLIDCKRIGTVDSAAAGLFNDLVRMVTRAGPSVIISHLEPGSQPHQALGPCLQTGTHPAPRSFADTDSALEWCEDQLIQGRGLSMVEPPFTDLAGQEVLAGLEGPDIRLLTTLTRTERFEAGSTIFEEGDDADALYFVATGAVNILLPTGHDGRYKRLARIGPGVAFGEMAALDGKQRSTTARADEPAICHVLAVSNLERLSTEHPGLTAALYRNLACSLSRRLRRANEEIRSLEE